MNQDLLLAGITGICVGAAAGFIGSFMVVRRMALVGDALSHVALPGIALALLFHFNPFLGAFGFLLIATLIIWGIEEKSKLPTEAIVGVLFASSLALGLLLTPEPELLEALFGDIAHVDLLNAGIAVVCSLIVILGMARLRNNLILSSISSELAVASRVNAKMVNLGFLLLVALVVALGVKVVGTLLMGALVVIPAVAAKNVCVRFGSFSLLAAGIGAVSAVAGIWIASVAQVSPGPVVVLSAGATFLISLGIRFTRSSR